MALTKENITRELLEKVAADLNKTILESDDPIPIDDVMEDALRADILEVGGMLVVEDMPKLKSETGEVLGAMGIELFAKVKDTDEVAKKTEESEKEDSKVEEKVPEVKTNLQNQKLNGRINKSKEKKIKYTRSNALIDALKMGKNTKKELVENANKLYVENGGSDNSNVAKALLGYVMPSLLILGIIKEIEKGVCQLNE